MFSIDIPSWLTLEIVVQGLSIFFGIIFGALLTLYLQKRQWAKEQAEKDMVEVYRPLLRDISMITKLSIEHPSLWGYTERYQNLKEKGRVSPPIHDILRIDMERLITSMNEVSDSFSKLDKKINTFCDNILNNTSIIMKDKRVHKLREHRYPLANKGDVLRGKKKKCISSLSESIENINKSGSVEKVDLKESPEEIFDQLFSLIKNDKEDYVGKRKKMLEIAIGIEKKLEYKARYPLKKYDTQ